MLDRRLRWTYAVRIDGTEPALRASPCMPSIQQNGARCCGASGVTVPADTSERQTRNDQFNGRYQGCAPAQALRQQQRAGRRHPGARAGASSAEARPRPGGGPLRPVGGPLRPVGIGDAECERSPDQPRPRLAHSLGRGAYDTRHRLRPARDSSHIPAERMLAPTTTSIEDLRSPRPAAATRPGALALKRTR